jgi:cell shape-determining protein MreC
MTIVLSIFLFIFVVYSALISFYVYRFAKIILTLEDKISDSLDVLDRSYEDVARIMTVPVFSDDEPTREAIDAVKRARNSVMSVIVSMSDISSSTFGSTKGSEK